MTPNGDFQATLTEQRLFAVMPLTGPPGPPMGVQDEGSPLPAFNIINFVGDGVMAVGDAPGNRITITIPGAVAGLVDSVFTRTGAVIAQSGDYTAAQVTNAVSTLGSYADPAWITSLAWSKITGEPSSFPPDAHVHAAADTTSGVFATARLGGGAASASVWLRGDSQWSTVPAADWTDIPGKPTTFPPDAHVHAAADTTSGVFATVRLGSGTASASTYLRGDSVWAAVSAGMAQTPWTSDIDGAGFKLTNVGQLGIGNALATMPDSGTGAHLVVGSSTDTSLGRFAACANVASASGLVGSYSFANYAVSATDKRIANITATTGASVDSGEILFYTWNFGAGGERMRISAAGNVGIGQGTPTAPMEFATAVGDKIYLWATGGVGAFGFGVQSADLQLFTPGINDVISLNPGRVQTLVAKDSKVGIGTAAPAAPLHVKASADNANGILVSGASASQFMVLESSASGGRIQHWNGAGFGELTLNPNGGAIKMYLGGSVKTLSVDGSGFVKAA